MAVLKKLAYAGGGAALGYLAWKALDDSAAIRANKALANGKTFVIAGAGFAGLAAASELARLFPDADNGKIILLDEDNYLLFTPMLTEAAGGELETRHIVHSLEDVSKRIQFVEGTVEEIDLAAKTVTVATGAKGSGSSKTLYRADHIVIALGSVTNFHGISGLAETAIPMKKLQDAAAVCNRAIACLQRASTEEDPGKRKELLTFVVAGGGYTGVETMAALNDLVRDGVGKYPNITDKDVRTLLIDPGDRLLMEITPDLTAYAESKLKERGVEIRMQTKVSGATATYVEIEGKERIPARTLIWAAGVKPSPLAEQLPCKKGKHGGIAVNADFQLPGHPQIWALGDCAEIPHADGKGFYAPTAQNATREGKLVARNILATLQGRKPKAFDYTPVGELALVGKHFGVARLYGHNFSGPIAWAMWRAVYLAKMPGARQKARILSDWLLDLIFGREPISLDPSASDIEKSESGI
ncbi:MAG: NAD(P)/FAD-dependent oxidoreductase [Acidobacteriota bacterium]|nr:NAD(P)/FAD-dependent oxidoreductase [Acidobacteriota bacterium]